MTAADWKLLYTMERRRGHMTVLVGMKAPDCTVPAVLPSGEIVPRFTLSQAIIGKYGLLFFYPLDFTFVCPSELLALDHRIDAFIHRDVEVIGISIRSEERRVGKECRSRWSSDR